MKTKYLFGMLLSGAMLAACTADDDFNTAPVAEANPSAPVFTVSLDDDGHLLNRAVMQDNSVETGKWQLRFETGDLLSLYHGIDANAATQTTPVLPVDLICWQNAIYKGETVGETGFEFNTQAIVNPGYAVLVYPAETGVDKVQGNLGQSNPMITIEADQNKKTKENTPYMSEIINIHENPEWYEPYAEAGYGKEYEIVLKRVGSTLSLALNVTKETTFTGVTENDIQKIELNAGVAKFTTGVAVKAVNAKPVATDRNKGIYPSWEWQSGLDLDASVRTDLETEAITTTDIENGVATFTLLPVYTSNTTAVSNGKVVVYTRYGKKEFTGNTSSSSKIWKNGSSTANITDGLSSLLNNNALWAGATKGTFFKDRNNKEDIGGHLSRTIDLDLTNLDMDKLHIEDEAHLLEALKVYDQIYGSKEQAQVTFILDGDENGEFVMSPTGWNKMLEYLDNNDEGYKHLHFKPCVEENPCYTVVLDNTGNAAVEVPELQFEDADIPVLPSGTVKLALALKGDWTYQSVDKEDKAKAIKGVGTLIVRDEATIDLKDYININEGNDSDIDVIIENGATANVAGKVYLKVKSFTNKGLLKIGENGQLVATNATVMENSEVAGNKATAFSDKKDGGVIENAGVLMVSEATGTTAVINNYGTIVQKNKYASTLITSQSDNAESALRTLFSNGGNVVRNNILRTTKNRIGTIELFDATASTSLINVKKAGLEQGFIKLTIAENNPTADKIGKVANYLVLENGCAMVTQGTVGSGDNAVDYVPTKVMYYEVKNRVVEMENFSTDNPLYGLIVHEGCRAYVTEGSYVKIGDNKGILYVKGTVGGYTSSSVQYKPAAIAETYFGDDVDPNDVGSTN